MEPNIHDEDLIETRRILELAAVKMASQRRSLDDLSDINAAQSAFRDQTLDSKNPVEEDLIFHLKVVAASKNEVLKSLFMKIMPDLIILLKKTNDPDLKKFIKAIYEHDSIIEHITNQDQKAAVEAMEFHLSN